MIGSPHEEISSSKLLNKKCCTKLNLDGFNSIEECTKKKRKGKGKSKQYINPCNLCGG
jgi:hypothetical protein